MYNPISTYRVQFNKDFTFKNLADQIDYLSQLGIKTLYASPVFKSTPGSIHGYDVTDPHVFNPEIGNETEFDEIIQALKEKNIGWIQDIVPNHMAMHSDNAWLMDVLKKGKKSAFADYFDIDFLHPDFNGKLIIPFLGKTAREAIKNGEIKFKLMDGQLGFSYYNFFFPVKEETMRSVLGKESGTDKMEKILLNVNSNPVRLEQLLDEQHYLLSPWQEASIHLNYRRFFTINSLISLKIENDNAFNDYHSFIFGLISQKKIQGLRIDHVDGLRLPECYLEKLRLLAGDEIFIVVEKILEQNESLIPDWPIEGTTGYDFLGTVNNLFTYQNNYIQLEKFYREFTRITQQPEEIIYQKKKLILMTSMHGDLDNLCRLFEKGDFIGNENEISSEIIKDAISEFLIYFPKYKSYSCSFPLSTDDKNIITTIISKATVRTPYLKKGLKIIRNIFVDQHDFTEEKKSAAMDFFLRCMQFTGPLMAKGVEDTVMYYYNCFIAHNEVGDSVAASGISVKEFHERMEERLKTFPMTLNTTSTHDTKRGEDARARLNVISEFPVEWIRLVKKWNKINTRFKTSIKNKEVPSLNEEYFIYQTLIGIFPFNAVINEAFVSRLDDYLMKALREAKISSDWNDPDLEYENSVKLFLHKIVETNTEFLQSFLPFQKKIAHCGVINSLSQLLLKATCPGIPDFYQGTELWDFSLVDPDNRRSVDYSIRKQILYDLIREQGKNPEEFSKNLHGHINNGHLKLWFMRVLLKERALHPRLFQIGQYIPLNVTGFLKEHVIAFARAHENTWFIVAVPLYIGIIFQKQDISDFNAINWKDTAIEIPSLAPQKWVEVQNGSAILAKEKIFLSDVLKLMQYPFLLKGTNETNSRKA